MRHPKDALKRMSRKRLESVANGLVGIILAPDNWCSLLAVAKMLLPTCSERDDVQAALDWIDELRGEALRDVVSEN